MSTAVSTVTSLLVHLSQASLFVIARVLMWYQSHSNSECVTHSIVNLPYSVNLNPS